MLNPAWGRGTPPPRPDSISLQPAAGSLRQVGACYVIGGAQRGRGGAGSRGAGHLIPPKQPCVSRSVPEVLLFCAHTAPRSALIAKPFRPVVVAARSNPCRGRLQRRLG